MNGYNILVVDDEPEITELIEIYLKNEDYTVYKATNGQECIALLQATIIQLVILDIMMPGMDGMEACRQIRETWNIPIIMLSAKSQDMDKIMGLTIGADDYITKPFNPIELTARVRSQLRRCFLLNQPNSGEQNANVIAVKDIVIFKDKHVVTKNGIEISLTPKEYDILLLLASNVGKVFSAEEIFFRVWQEKYFDSHNTVMVHMWRLREKIEDDPKNPRMIETIWGVGYKIEE
ncbi:response regulator transcription factor [Gorillibacterium massiliense]|uniref:response regulator transcription factor n=1 Tax=Gorillibacterium massiliense TaxID=1280390 RepID=UPI0005931EEB|nr:response regulator transcription factor [Gorillibacterium massiliense]